MIKEGQLREWITRDESGGIHDADLLASPHFIILTAPYWVDELGHEVVDIFEDGKVVELLDASHVEYWSLIVSE